MIWLWSHFLHEWINAISMGWVCYPWDAFGFSHFYPFPVQYRKVHTMPPPVLWLKITLPDTDSSTLEFAGSWTVRNKPLFFYNYPVFDIVSQQQKRDKEGKKIFNEINTAEIYGKQYCFMLQKQSCVKPILEILVVCVRLLVFMSRSFVMIIFEVS